MDIVFLGAEATAFGELEITEEKAIVAYFK
jgi:hypothetical protein